MLQQEQPQAVNKKFFLKIKKRLAFFYFSIFRYNRSMINIKNRRGFTLVEMMVVISLMAVLLVMMVSNAQKQKIKARNNVRIADIQTIRLALEDYKLACGEYPAWVGEDANNGCRNGESFSDFLAHIPVNPNHPDPQWSSYITSSGIDDSNGYLYAGLSTSDGGKCYDYHIGVEIEMTNQDMKILDTDHDAKKGTGKFDSRCSGADVDFGQSGEQEDERGMYDFRSNSNF